MLRKAFKNGCPFAGGCGLGYVERPIVRLSFCEGAVVHVVFVADGFASVGMFRI